MRITRLLSLPLFFLAFLLWGPLTWGEDKTSSWIEMIKREEALLLSAKKDLDKYISEQPARIQKVRKTTEELHQQLHRLNIVYNIEELNC